MSNNQTEDVMKKSTQEKYYREVTTLYDMAEELASTVESEFVKDPRAQIELVAPLIDSVADAADILTEEYISLLEHPSRKKSAQNRVESALRKIFMALEEYRKQVSAGGKKMLAALANIADPVAKKIRQQVEKIVVIFMQLVELSLERIMHKYEIEEFRRSHNKTAAALQIGY